MSYRVDRSPKISSKVSPMHSPRISASGVFGSRTIPPSPLRKGLEGPPSVSILPAVDYDDVFGGPPRFAPSLFAAQTPQTPSTVLDRSCPRTPSFRSSSFPVFELPVFGDDVFGSSSAVDQRNSSLPHEAISKEEVYAPNVIPEAIPASLLQSKPGSRSSSRCMSPARSVVTSPGHHGQGEMHKSSDTFVGRSSTGNALSRNLSSSSSFDETRSNTCDSSAILSRTDMVGSSLLSSPPHASVWGHLNRVHGVSNTKQKGVNTLDDVDDVFGGLPRTYSLALSAAYQRTSSPPRTKSASSKGITHHMAQKNTFTSQMFEPSGTLDPTFQKSLSNGRQASQDNFVDIRTDREKENSALKKLDGRTGEGLALVNDMKFATQLASKWMPARPPPSPSPAPSTPSTPLRHKSWKDWASEASSDQTVSHDCSSKVGEMAAVNGVAPTLKKGPNKSTTISHIQKGSAETVYKKQLENSQESQKLQGKYALSSSNINVLKVKPLKQTMDLEDRELQAILTNAWKLNEKWEKKKSAAARTRQESTRVLETRLQEPHIKEGKRQSKKLSKPVPQVSHTKEDRGENMQRKSWRNYSEQKSESPGEPAKAGCSAEDCMTNSCQPSTQDIVKEKTENPVMQNGIFEAEDNFDPEEIVSEVTEEMPVSDTSNEVPAKWAGVAPKRDSGKSAKEDMEVCVAEKPLAASTNGEGPTLTALNTDFGQGDLQEFLMSEGLENTGPLTVINASLEGFQEIEGETLERRKARWARHQQAKERAAKAIEEMQRRDAEVQRQQEEKQQLAGIADHQIKRWASGKEANIRALLSNLQHVLWENSGWQPVSLRDLIEGSDVKKAYRKATLFVHPDKVQQKGATLHQKYVAERVFDILQEAWKTFNLQEFF